MKTLMINSIIALLRSMLQNGKFIETIKKLIMDAFDFNMENKDKKAAVMKSIKDLGMTFGPLIAPIATMLLSSLVEMYIAKALIQNPDLNKS